MQEIRNAHGDFLVTLIYYEISLCTTSVNITHEKLKTTGLTA